MIWSGKLCKEVRNFFILPFIKHCHAIFIIRWPIAIRFAWFSGSGRWSGGRWRGGCSHNFVLRSSFPIALALLPLPISLFCPFKFLTFFIIPLFSLLFHFACVSSSHSTFLLAPSPCQLLLHLVPPPPPHCRPALASSSSHSIYLLPFDLHLAGNFPDTNIICSLQRLYGLAVVFQSNKKIND